MSFSIDAIGSPAAIKDRVNQGTLPASVAAVVTEICDAVAKGPTSTQNGVRVRANGHHYDGYGCVTIEVASCELVPEAPQEQPAQLEPIAASPAN